MSIAHTKCKQYKQCPELQLQAVFFSSLVVDKIQYLNTVRPLQQKPVWLPLHKAFLMAQQIPFLKYINMLWAMTRKHQQCGCELCIVN